MSFRLYPLLLAFAAAAQTPAGLREAARLDQAGRCGEAEQIYRRLLAQPEPGAAVLNNAGNHFLACGQPEKSRELFERLVRIAPTHVNANLQLARLALNAREFSRAESLLRRLAADHPTDFDILYLLGRVSARAGQVTQAREALEAAHRLRPGDLDAMVECGLANAASGDFSRAVFLLARAQQQAPQQPAIAAALARASEEAGYYGDAVLAYERYLNLRPDDQDAQRDYARALAFTPQGREQGALRLERYVRAHPSNALGHFYLAQIRWKDDAAAALDSLAKAIDLDAGLTQAHVARAWLLHRMGQDSQALTHLETALRQAPENVRTLDQSGVVLLSLDRAAEAEAALRKASRIAPADADVALHLGRALMDQGKEQEGQHWLDTYQKLRPARQRDPRSEPGMIELATLDPAGRRAREIERFRVMARSRPDDPLLQLRLAELLQSDGRVAEALREFEVLSGLNGDAAIWAQAGRALLSAGESGRARPFLERAGPSLDLAEALLRTGEAPAAFAVLDRIPTAERGAEYGVLLARTLESSGRADDSRRELAAALKKGGLPASSARQAGLLLARQGEYRDALHLLSRASEAAAADRGLQLAEAAVLGLSGDTQAAEQRLRKLELRWPEWDQPWLVHGLLLADSHKPEQASARFHAAKALGLRDRPPACESLRAWVSGACGR